MSDMTIAQADDRVSSFQTEKEIKKFDNIELSGFGDEGKGCIWLDKEDYEKIKDIAKKLNWEK